MGNLPAYSTTGFLLRWLRERTPGAPTARTTVRKNKAHFCLRVTSRQMGRRAVARWQEEHGQAKHGHASPGGG